MKLRRFFSLSVVLALNACGSDDFPPYQTLEGLRVLGLQADAPEVAPGATVQITPIVSWPDRESDVTLVHSAVGCPDPGLRNGVSPGCPDADERTTLLAEEALDLAAVASGTSDFPNEFSLTAPTDFLEGLSDAEKLYGRDYLVVYTVTVSNGAESVTFRRVRVSLNPEPATNPALTNIKMDDSTLAGEFPAKGAKLVPEFTASADEVLFTWFISKGEFKRTRTVDTQSNEIEKSPKAAASPQTIVVMARDENGGLDYLVFDF